MRTATKQKSLPEIWKEIEGFPGYEVSSFGRVRSIDRYVWCPSNKSMSLIKGKILKWDTTGKEYAQVALCLNGVKYKKLVHRLVAIAFIPNHYCRPQVNHKDLNKMNNNVENLEWMTNLQNTRHAHAAGVYDNCHKGEQCHNAILNNDAVRHIRQKVLRNVEYCKLYGVKPSTISCLQSEKYGKRWAHI